MPMYKAPLYNIFQNLNIQKDHGVLKISFIENFQLYSIHIATEHIAGVITLEHNSFSLTHRWNRY